MGYYHALRYLAYAGGFAGVLSFLFGQAPEVIRFIPGRFRENALHQIDLYNPFSQPLNLSHWLLVTREYSVRLPAGFVLYPRQRFRIAKSSGDLRLDRYPDFLIRFPEEGQPGAYVALLDEQRRLRRGIYLAPLPQVVFLPDSGINITREGKRIPFFLPSETAPAWEFIPWEPDPITGVVRIGTQWRYTVADAEKETRIYAPLRFPLLVASYEQGAVHLFWEVETRDACEKYRLERMGEQRRWETIATFPCPTQRPARLRVEHYDLTVREGAGYRYRLVYEMPPTLRIESLPAQVRCQHTKPPLQVSATHGYLRLQVAQSQPVKVRLLDAYFTERLRLYDGWLNGSVENVFVWDTSQVRNGRWIVIWTAGRRYWLALPAR